jgi:hypothetical protein
MLFRQILVFALASIPSDGEGLQPRFCGRELRVQERRNFTSALRKQVVGRVELPLQKRSGQG